MGEAGQRYAKPDAMPAVALLALAHTLICNHISHMDERHVRKEGNADGNRLTSLCHTIFYLQLSLWCGFDLLVITLFECILKTQF